MKFTAIMGTFCLITLVTQQQAYAAVEDQTARYQALSPFQQELINITCDQKKQYASSYHVCLRTTIDNLSAPGKPDLSALNASDQEETERSCAKRLLFTAKAYHSCLSLALETTQKESYRPDLSRLSTSDRTTVEEKCENSKNFGPGSYNQCLRHQVSKIKGVSYGTTELWDLNPEQKAQVREICEIAIYAQDKSAYSFCLQEEAALLLGKTPPKRPESPVTAPATHKAPGTTSTRPVLQKTESRKPSNPQFTMRKSLAELDKKTPGATSLTMQGMSLPPMPANIARQSIEPDRLYASAAPSVYVVLAGKSPEDFNAKKDISQGSAVAVSSDTLLTNCHVVDEKPFVLIIQERQVQPARILGGDKEEDRCILQSMEHVTPIPGIRTFSDLKVGERIYTIGTPSGLERTLSEGLISGLRDMEPHGHVVQISAPISPGSSGGGLFDNRGNLIGITTFGVQNTGQLNFAVSADQYWK